jgi:PTS system nitrogen regulatory IIA component
MQLTSILTPERTLCGAPGRSKKRALENAATFICEDAAILDANELFSNLMERERLGSTGLGKGIAIPHCRIKNCSAVIGSLIKLDEPVDFDAIDGAPVDLLFVLLVPEDAHQQHLDALAKIAELFSQEDYCQQLRNCTDSQSLFNAAVSRV